MSWLSPDALAAAECIALEAPPLTERQRVLIRETFAPLVQLRIGGKRKPNPRKHAA